MKEHRDGNQILGELAAPGRLLAFVDESIIPGKPLSFLMADYRVMVATLMHSEKYSEAESELKIRLEAVGVPEFHGRELFRPGGASLWRGVDEEKRRELAQFMFRVLLDRVEQIPFISLSGEEFEEKLKHQLPQAVQKVKAAHETCFYNILVPYLRLQQGGAALVADAFKDATNELRVWSVASPFGLYEEGLIEADSRYSIGLQIADWAAYSYTRRMRSAERIRKGAGSKMDRVMIEGWLLTQHLYVNLLDTEPG